MRKAVTIFAFLGAFAVAGCVEEDTAGVAKPLESCGKVVTSLGSSYTEAPILKEGAGKVGIATQQQTADGKIHQRYSLVDCADKSITRVEQDWTLATAPAQGATVQDLVNRLRSAGRLTASGQLARGGQEQGFQVTQGHVDAVNNERAACGCQTHYPDLLWQY